jgi:hypothetical protein
METVLYVVLQQLQSTLHLQRQLPMQYSLLGLLEHSRQIQLWQQQMQLDIQRMQRSLFEMLRAVMFVAIAVLQLFRQCQFVI